MLLRDWEIIVDLITFDMPDFDIILGMNFLSHIEQRLTTKKKSLVSS